MKKIDPIERALDAYFELEDGERRIFAESVKRISRYTQPLQIETPKRGRPPGSKNRKTELALKEDSAIALDLRHNNGTATENL